MKRKVIKIFVVALFLIGIAFILNASSGMTGFVVADSIGKGVSGIIGLKKDLERKKEFGESFFTEILRSYLNRIRKLPKNIWKDYDSNLTYEQNKQRLMHTFHKDNPIPGLEINDEIREGYRKVLDLSPEQFYGKGKPKEIAKRIWKNTKRKYLNSKDFYQFKNSAIKEIQRLDKEALSNEIVPILETRPNISVEETYKDAGFKSKVVYFGPIKLYGKYKSHQIKELEEEHFGKDVFKYHIIYDPSDLKKGKIPHGHWELEYIKKRKSK